MQATLGSLLLKLEQQEKGFTGLASRLEKKDSQLQELQSSLEELKRSRVEMDGRIGEYQS